MSSRPTASRPQMLGCVLEKRTTFSDLIFEPAFSIGRTVGDRKSTRLNSSHTVISYAVFCLKKKKKTNEISLIRTRSPRIELHEYRTAGLTATTTVLWSCSTNLADVYTKRVTM